MWIRIYSLLWLLALPLILARLLLRSIREPGYREDLVGRFGLGGTAADRPAAGAALWFHAVSAGEVHAIVPLLMRLRAADPARPLLLTTSTATGRARARARLGETVELAWLPFDLPACVDAFLDRRRPALLALVETELWPVLIGRCRARRIPVVLVNGRLSPRSARGYARLPALVRPMLGAFDRLLCQDAETAARFAALGAGDGALRVTGSLKFEPEWPADMDARAATLRERIVGAAEEAFVIVVGSTHAGEEAALLAELLPALERHRHWHLVLVPRHPQRFDAVAACCERAGLPAQRASTGSAPGARLLLWDLMGDLFALYAAADAAFVGGSLVPVGGHNAIEAAVHGTPVVVGPGAHDFGDVNARLAADGGLVVVPDAAEVCACLERWAQWPEERARAGAAARAAVRANGGALETTAAALGDCLQSPP